MARKAKKQVKEADVEGILEEEPELGVDVETCPRCQGTGSWDGDECTCCGGEGTVEKPLVGFFVLPPGKCLCPKCHGKGFISDETLPCSRCDGEKFINSPMPAIRYEGKLWG
jgi:DnaJ-class molecular chaperone